jgi:hypothetical protein
MNKIAQHMIALVLVFLILACNLGSVTNNLSTSVTPTAMERATLMPYQPAQTVNAEVTPVVIQPAAGEVTPGAAQPGQELQPCSLITSAEAEAILGEPATAPTVSSGGCAFNNASDSLYAVSVGVAQAGQAEGILQGQVMLMGFAGVQFDEAKMTRFNNLSDAQDFKTFFTELVAAAQGSTVVKAQLVEDGVSDVVYWAWLTAQSRRQGAYVAVRGKTMVNVNVVVADTKPEQSMFEASQALANKIFDRLPANFILGMPTVAPTQPLPTLVPGGPPTLVPGGPPTTVPGGPPTTVPGGPPTTVPGSPPTLVPGGPPTAVPGSPPTLVPGGPPTTVPGSPPTAVK